MQVAVLKQQLKAREAEATALISDINASTGPTVGPGGVGFDSEDLAAAAGSGRADAGGAAYEKPPASEGAGRHKEAGKDKLSVGKVVQWLVKQLPRPWGK